MKRDYLESVYFLLTGIIFLFVSGLHFLRIIFHLPLIVGNLEIPFLLSYGGLPTSLFLTAFAFWLVQRNTKK